MHQHGVRFGDAGLGQGPPVALTAVATAALTVYDMCKAIGPTTARLRTRSRCRAR
ncbi:MAG TPA: cyclic pyranopterin monophosphate synthase MoaC [Kofleriaceae bacterium]|nr:cyclic pyranopterin monophosphate synthase MoaC [Kofleriaceae bacterium]